MMSAPSENRPLIKDEHATKTRSIWVSMAAFLVFQVLILTPGEITMATLAVQFVRTEFARERNFTIPVGVNGCVVVNGSSESTLTDIQSETALFSTYQSFLTDFLPVLTGLPLIAVSDYTGRRPIFILRCLGTLALCAGFLVVSFFDVSVYISLIGCAVFGLTGGFVLIHAFSMLYVTDLVTRDQRAVALSAVYGGQYAVIYLAPLFFNFVLESVSYSFQVIFVIMTGFAAMALLWMMPSGLVRESVQTRPIVRGLASDLVRGIRDMFVNATDDRRWRIVVLLACYAIVALNMHGFQNTVDLYGLGYPFCWTPYLVGIFSLVYGVPNAILSPVIVWFLELFVTNYWVIYLSILSGMAQFFATAVANSNGVLIYGASFLGIFFGISQPVYIALITNLVATKSHGAVYAVYTLVYAVTGAASLVIQSYAYSVAVTSGHARDIFYTMTALSAVVFVPTIVLHVLEPKGGFHPDQTTEGNDESSDCNLTPHQSIREDDK